MRNAHKALSRGQGQAHRSPELEDWVSKGHELFDALAAYNKKISDEADSLAAKVLPNSYKQIGGAMLSYMKGPGITDHQIAEMRGMLNVLSKKFTGKDDIPFPSPEA